MGEQVTLFEVGPRDGLQNQSSQVAANRKIELVDLLSRSGMKKIEVASFVSPRWVPQMADSGQVMDGISRVEGVTYSALVPNMQGMDAALRHHADEVAVFTAASDAFNLKNTNSTIADSLDRFRPIIRQAKRHTIPVRGYVSTVIDCPYSGPVEPQRVLQVAQRLLEMGCYQISLGDTLGNATPAQVRCLLDCLLQHISPDVLAGHFHDTSGRALENISTCLEFGLRTFDASIAGLGGCPYAPGAKGNVATESVIDHLHSLGFQTGIDLKNLELVKAFAAQLKDGQI